MAEAYVPLSFAPGEAYQFDWSHEVVLINGTTVTVKVAHVRLCHSRMLFARAYPREIQANDGGWKTGGTFRPRSQRTALAARPDTARTDTPIAREFHRLVPGG
jgi:hypothetical protein